MDQNDKNFRGTVKVEQQKGWEEEWNNDWSVLSGEMMRLECSRTKAGKKIKSYISNLLSEERKRVVEEIREWVIAHHHHHVDEVDSCFDADFPYVNSIRLVEFLDDIEKLK